MSQAILDKAASIVNANTRHQGADNPICVLSQIDLDGSPTAATITPSKADGLRWVTLCSGLESNWSKRCKSDPSACLCFSTGEYNISLVGRLQIIADPEVKREMWYKGLENHFSGPEDPGYCVLRFETQRYNLLVDWQEVRGTF